MTFTLQDSLKMTHARAQKGDPRCLANECRSCPFHYAALCRSIASASVCEPQTVHSLKTARDSTLVVEGDAPNFIGVLKRGYLRVEKLRVDGRRTLLGLYHPGNLVGWLPGQTMQGSLEAATDVEICAFDFRAVRRLIERDASFSRCLMREVSIHHQSQLEMIWRRGALNSRERVIAFLVIAAEIMPTDPEPDGSIIVRIELARRDWADLSNTTVETISRTMTYLADKDLVTTLGDNCYRLRDLARLAYLAGIDASSEIYPRKHAVMTAVNDCVKTSARVNRIHDKGPRGRGQEKGKSRDVQEKARHRSEARNRKRKHAELAANDDAQARNRPSVR